MSQSVIFFRFSMPHPAERRLVFEHLDEPGYTPDLPCYLRYGGYEAFTSVLAAGGAEKIIATALSAAERLVQQEPLTL